jgi:hypothetical protein
MNTTGDTTGRRGAGVNAPTEPTNGRDALVSTASDTTPSEATDGGLRQRTLTTADLAASANRREREAEERAALREGPGGDRAGATQTEAQREAEGLAREAEGLAPLFDEHIAGDFRSRWSIVQQGFVDDPQKAVREGDELVAQVIKSLAESFAQ